MYLLLIASDVFLISVASTLGLIYYNHRAQQKAFSKSKQGPKPPAWLFRLQNGLVLCSWVAALAFGILCNLGVDHFHHARITLYITILFAQWTLLCNVAIFEYVGRVKPSWIIVTVVATLLMTMSIALVSISHPSLPLERAAQYFPPSSVSTIELVTTFTMIFRILRMTCSAKDKFYWSGMFSWRLLNLALLWIWTALLGKESLDVVMIIQSAQLCALVLPLRYSPMAIVRYKRQADERQHGLRLEASRG